MVKLFMDESGNGNNDQTLIVGAVELGDDADDVERNIRDLFKSLSARSSLAGLPTFEEFRKNGFHSYNDPLEVSGPFLELLRTIYFRAYMFFTNRAGVPGNTEADRIEYMYVKLVSDLLLRHRKERELLIYIEQSTGMGRIIQRIPISATKQAHEALGTATNLPQLKIEMVAKTDYMSTAIIDYVMSAVGRWLREGRTTNPSVRAYRAFREVEPYVSVLYSFEDGLISSRKTPLK